MAQKLHPALVQILFILCYIIDFYSLLSVIVITKRFTAQNELHYWNHAPFVKPTCKMPSAIQFKYTILVYKGAVIIYRGLARAELARGIWGHICIWNPTIFWGGMRPRFNHAQRNIFQFYALVKMLLATFQQLTHLHRENWQNSQKFSCLQHWNLNHPQILRTQNSASPPNPLHHLKKLWPFRKSYKYYTRIGTKVWFCSWCGQMYICVGKNEIARCWNGEIRVLPSSLFSRDVLLEINKLCLQTVLKGWCMFH